MFMGVVALCCVVLITECHNSHIHSQGFLTKLGVVGGFVVTFYFKNNIFTVLFALW